ncbi:10072_t:CDS:2, partial [Cetraspora pellucida]
MFRKICEIAVKFYKSIHNDEAACRLITTQLIHYKHQDYPFDFDYDSSKTPNLWWGVIEDEYSYLQNLAQILFAVVPSQAKSMAKIHSFYISNLKNELKYYGKELSESELRDSALALTTYAAVENNNITLEQHENTLESIQLRNEKLQISFIVDLSHSDFGGQSNFEEISHTTYTTQGSGNMDFDPIEIVE